MITKIDKININSTDYDIAVKGENVDGSVAAAATLDNLTATIDELNYSSGLTDNIQSQIDSANKNIDDLQNAIVETDSSILDLSAKVFDNTREIVKISEMNLDNRVSDLEKPSIIETSDSVIKDTKDGGYKIVEIEGNTEQKTYSGKNVLDTSGLGGQTYTGVTVTSVYNNNNELEYINVNGTAETTFYCQLKVIYNIPDGIYTLSGCPSGGSVTTFDLRLENNGEAAALSYGGGNAEFPTATFYNGFDYALYITIREGYTANNLKFYPMLRKADIEDDTYEPYVGGTPSPNPSYPQPMLSTGDIALSQGYWDVGLVYDTKHVRSESVYSCKTGDNVKIIYGSIATAMGFVFYDSNMNMLGIAHDSSGYVREFSAIAPTNTSYFGANVRVSDEVDTTPQTVGKITLTINGKYLGCVKSHGKNLFDENKILYASEWSKIDGWYRGGAWNLYRARNNIFSDIIYKENTQYTVKVNTKGGSVFTALALMITYTDGTDEYKLISNSDLSECSTTVITKNGKSVKSIDTTFTDDGIILIKDFLIQEGVVENPIYEPYKETSAYFLTAYPMIKGSTLYKEDGLFKVKHTMSEEVFDGVNNLLTGTDGVFDDVNYAYKIVVHNLNYNNYYSNIGKATHSIEQGGGGTEGANISKNNNSMAVHLKNSISGVLLTDNRPTVISKINEWCKTNPVHIIYERLTPIIETLDTQSQIALNGLKTFEGVTHVEFDTRVQPKTFKAKVGTTDEAALALENSLRHDSQDVQIKELTAAMLALSQI